MSEKSKTKAELTQELLSLRERLKILEEHASWDWTMEARRILFEANPHPMWVFDLRTFAILGVNDAACSHYGYPRQEFLTLSLKDLFDREDIPWLETTVLSLAGVSGKAGVWRNRRKDGTLLSVEMTIHDLLFEGKPARLAFADDVTDRRRVEEALLESEERYRSLVESAPIAIVVHSEGNIVYANSEALNLVGAAKPEELIGRKVMEFLHPDSVPLVRERIRQITGEGKKAPLAEEKYIRLDGAVIDVEVVGIPILYQGKPASQVAMRDITERKLTEESLRKSDLFHRKVIENAAGVPFVLMFGPSIGQGRYEFVGSGIQNLLGVTPAEFSEQFFVERIRETIPLVPDLPRDADAGREKIIRGEISQYRADLRVSTASGEEKWINDSSIFIRDEKTGTVIGAMGVLIDITHRKRIEHALIESEGRYRSLFDRMMDGVYRSTHEGRFVEVNAAMVRMFGYESKEEMLHIDIKKDLYFAPSDRDSLFLDSGQEKVEIFRMRRKDNAEIWVEDHGQYVHDEHGNVIFHEGILRDVTERVRGQEKIIQVTRLKEGLLGPIKMQEKLNLITDGIVKIFHADFARVWMTKEGDLCRHGCPHANVTDGEEQCRDRSCCLHLASSAGRYTRIDGAHRRVPLGAYKIGRVASGEEKKFIINDVVHDSRIHDREWAESLGLKSFAGFRLISDEGKPIGVMALFSKEEIGPDDEKFLEDLANTTSQVVLAGVALEAVHSSEERYRSLFDRMMDGVYRSTHEGRFVEVNAAMVRMFGYESKEEMLHIDIKKDLYFAPSDRDSLFLDSGQEKVEIFRMRRKDNAEIWVEDHGQYVHDEHGNVIFHEGILRDVTDRLTSEQAIRKSEEKYREIVTWSPIGIYQSDESGRILTANMSLAAMLGYNSVDDLSTHILQRDIYFDEAERQRLFAGIARSGGAGSAKNVEVRWKKKDGSPIWVLLTLHVVEDEDGRYRHSTGFVIDITERKLMEEALRNSEEKYRDLVENIADVIFVIDGQGILTYVSPVIESLAHYIPAELIGHPFSEFVVPEDLPMLMESYRRTLAGNWEPLEYRLRAKDGEPRWVRTVSRPMMVGEQTVGLRGVITDITERKKAEEALRLGSQLLDHVTDSIFVYDIHGKFIYVNEAAPRVLGYALHELLEKNIGEIEAPEQAKRFGANIEDLIVRGEMTFESVHLHKNGTHIPVEIHARLVEREGRQFVISAVRDITERKKAEEERVRLEERLLQAQKLESIGTLAGGIAHDFNNILAIILGYSSLLQKTSPSPETLAHGLSVIAKAVERGADLVKQILTFARKSETLYGTIDVNIIIKELVKMLSETLPKTISLETDLDRQLPLIHADLTQIHQTLLNICINARDAMPDGGSIRIHTSLVDGNIVHAAFQDAGEAMYIRISISDSGMGMDDVTKGRIFEPFFTTKEKGKGTGLGLAVAYGVVSNHQGFIDVESMPGAGTAFHLYFPVPKEEAPPEVAAESAISEDSARQGTETILIVEDETLLQEMVKAILEDRGYTVLTANDGDEAVEQYRRCQNVIALVLTDLGLPKLDGQGVCRKIKEMNPHARVILASGYIEPEVRAAFLRMGAKGIIQKPYEPMEMLRVVREAIDN